MPTSLETSKLFQEIQAEEATKDPLRSEFGWPEVGKGLNSILLGYAIGVVGVFLGVSMLLFAMPTDEMRDLIKGNHNTVELVMLLTVGFILLSSLFSYAMILRGKWKCLMNAPERHAAKWLIFACMLCMVLGPVLSIFTSVGGEGAQNYKSLGKGRDGIAEVKFEGVGGIIQIIGSVLSMASTVFFILFLRAVAVCFESKTCINLIHVYLGFSALLIGTTVQMTLTPRALMRLDVLLALGAGWLLSGLWYIALIVGVRMMITTRLAQMRPILEV
jgi:hypothetical protein